MQRDLSELRLIIIDEISMVGSMKLAKINFRFQDIADGAKKPDFMGGISFVASGKLSKYSKFNLFICLQP